MAGNGNPAALNQGDEEMRRLTDLLLDLYEKNVGNFSLLALVTASIGAIYTIAMRINPDEAPTEVAKLLEYAAKRIRAGEVTPYKADKPQ